MKQKGFTLIEVLIVVAMIGIILAVVLPNISLFLSPTRADRSTITNYCPERGYELRGCCIIFSKYYTLANNLSTYIYSESLKMYCNDCFVQLDIIDRRK